MLSELPKLSIRRGAGFFHLGEDGLEAHLVLKQQAKGFGTSRSKGVQTVRSRSDVVVVSGSLGGEQLGEMDGIYGP